MRKLVTSEIATQAIAMRKTGAIYSNIAKTLNISIASVGNIMKGVEFTEQEKLAIETVNSKIRSDARKLVPKKAKIRISQAKYTDQERNVIWRQQLLQGRLSYKPHELAVKPFLEEHFKCSFKKECVDQCIVPFASQKHLVFFSNDCRTDHHVVKQVAIVASVEDKRARHVYLMNTKGLAAKRLSHERFNVTLFPSSELFRLLNEAEKL